MISASGEQSNILMRNYLNDLPNGNVHLQDESDNENSNKVVCFFYDNIEEYYCYCDLYIEYYKYI